MEGINRNITKWLREVGSDQNVRGKAIAAGELKTSIDLKNAVKLNLMEEKCVGV
ncbi:hypothetical protein HAX54_026502, partial [Datura stramonium]|nr:hypothetical protein [Datura stramonium]